jgi:hypothetical protein
MAQILFNLDLFVFTGSKTNGPDHAPGAIGSKLIRAVW